MASLAHFDRAGPFVELGEESGFDAFEVRCGLGRGTLKLGR
jgi:hypothetical protein